MTAVRTAHYAVVTANPLATQKACEVLDKRRHRRRRARHRAGGARPGRAAVLGDRRRRVPAVLRRRRPARVQAYDGREVGAACRHRELPALDLRLRPHRAQARRPGLAAGPSAYPASCGCCRTSTREHGKTAWRDLFTPAVTLADDGFEISPRLAAAIADAAPKLKVDPNASAYFLNPDGSPKTAGTQLTNPAYAKTLGVIASDPQSFYTGDIARAIVAAAVDTSGGRTPSLMTPKTLPATPPRNANRSARPTAARRSAACRRRRPAASRWPRRLACSSISRWPITSPTDVDLNGGKPTVMGVHLISEAERLAYADRDKYVADTDFVPLPGGSPNTLLNSDYLAGRAALISEQHTMGTAKPGDFGPPTTPTPPTPEHGTSQISIVDAEGNAAVADHDGGIGVRVVPHGRRIHSQQPAHRLLRRTRRTRRRSGGQPGPAGQAAAQLDGTDAGFRPVADPATGKLYAMRGLAGRLGDHPVRRENRCGNDRLGP